jgi:hypothetical protein
MELACDAHAHDGAPRTFESHHPRWVIVRFAPYQVAPSIATQTCRIGSKWSRGRAAMLMGLFLTIERI